MNDIVDDPNMNPRDVAEPLRRAIGDRYLTYALSTIMNRALPDARDGSSPFIVVSFMQCADCV